MDSTDNSALMTLDLKRSRILIHKSTLKKLNDPKYIQFLINPEEMFIAFLGSDTPLAGGTANKVNLVRVPNQSVEFYSNSLLEGVVNMVGMLDFRYSYRLSGEVAAVHRVAYFSMKTLKKNERRKPTDG